MKLVFVYNAEGGLAHGIIDSIHKLVSPATYPCSLCAITHGLTRMKDEWREWLDHSGMPVEFFHRGDFRESWPGVNAPLPAIFVEGRDGLTTLVSAAELARISDVGELVAMVEHRCERREQ